MSSKTGPHDPEAMMRDWMTIWQSEIAAVGVDREMQESLTRMAGLWARTAMQAVPGHDPSGRPGPDAASRPTSAADAPHAEPLAPGELALLRGEIAGLRRRIEQLEARGRRPAKRGKPPPGT